jgi:hypothetical protein
MQMGLLWFDSDPGRDVLMKAQDAARRYRDKFGAPPDTCYVNLEALEAETSISVGGAGSSALRVVPSNRILAHHFWVGIEERREPSLT